MRGGGEVAHLDADLGDQLLGGDHPDPGDRIQPLGVAGKRGDHPVDLGGDLVDLGGRCVDAFQHQLAQEAVVVVEVAGQRPCSKTAILDRMLARASWASALGLRWPAMSAWSI